MPAYSLNYCPEYGVHYTCSLSHQAFLASLHGKAKSSVKNGNRAEHIDFTISIDDLVNLWLAQEGRCVVSGVFLTHHKDGSGTTSA
jgi:hypothetical protein